MTLAQFDREKNYRISLAIAKAMLSQGLIDKKDFSKIDALLITKYRPIIA